MTKFLVVLAIILISLGYVTIRYRRGIIAGIKLYRVLRDGRREIKNKPSPASKTSLEMRLCKSCNRWFQSDGTSICIDCKRIMNSD